MTGAEQGEPRTKEAEGGSRKDHSGSITWGQVLVVLGIIVAIGGAWAYLETKFDALNDAVHENALKLAAVNGKVESIEKDIRRLEQSKLGAQAMSNWSP